MLSMFRFVQKPTDSSMAAQKKYEVETIKDNQPLNPYTEVQILQHHTDIVRHLLLVDETRCISAGDDGSAVVWDIQYGCKIFVFQGHSRPITSLLILDRLIGQFDDPHLLLLTAASDKQMKLWDIESGCCLQSLTEHNSSIRCLKTLYDGEIICSGGDSLCIWNRNGHLLDTFTINTSDGDINLLIAVKNQRLIAATDKQLVVFEVVSSDDSEEKKIITVVKKLPAHRETITALINVSGGTFASGSLDGTIILWTTHSFSPSRYFNSQSEYKGADKKYPYSVQHFTCLDERYLFAAIGSGFSLYDVVAGRVLASKAAAHYSKIIQLTFVYNETFLATSSEDGSIRFWGCKAQILDSLKQHQHQLSGADTDKTLAMKDSCRSTIERFTGMSREQLKTFHSDPIEVDLLGECLGHSGGVQMLVDYGSDGFVSCGMDGLVISWKDGVVQSLKRTDIVREMVLGPDP